jgi:hypothetical protein
MKPGAPIQSPAMEAQSAARERQIDRWPPFPEGTRHRLIEQPAGAAGASTYGRITGLSRIEFVGKDGMLRIAGLNQNVSQFAG